MIHKSTTEVGNIMGSSKTHKKVVRDRARISAKSKQNLHPEITAITTVVTSPMSLEKSRMMGKIQKTLPYL